MNARHGLLLTTILSCFILFSCMSQEQQEQTLHNSEPQSVNVTVNVGGDSRAERFLGTFDQISRLSLDIVRNYGNKRVLTDFPLEHDGSKWTGTINKLIVGFDYTITGHAYKCSTCRNNFFISNFDNYTVSTLAGNGASGFSNGNVSSSTFNQPKGVVVDFYGNVIVADYYNHLIRKIDTNGNVTTLAGSGSEGSNDGNSTQASFNLPFYLIMDSMGNIFLSDYGNHTVRKIDTNGNVTTIAGSAGIEGSDNGNRTSARFKNPTGLAFDSKGNILVSDYGNHLIRKIDTVGNVSTIAGTANVSGSDDGNGIQAKFNQPYGIVVDSSDNIYVADYSNNLIRKIDTFGNVTTFAGSGERNTVDENRLNASFNGPIGLEIDSSNNLYISEYKGHVIRKINTSGQVTTIAGIVGSSGSTDGEGT